MHFPLPPRFQLSARRLAGERAAEVRFQGGDEFRGAGGPAGVGVAAHGPECFRLRADTPPRSAIIPRRPPGARAAPREGEWHGRAWAGRERWQIEIFFRTIKQCLRIKTFVGTSANALAVQIWTALLALLLVVICRFRSTFGWHLSRLVALLRVNLFTYRDLRDWLDNPFHTPPISPPEQLALTF